MMGAAQKEATKSNPGKTFDGAGITLQRLSPVGYVDVNGSQFEAVPKADGTLHHFKSKTPFPGLTIYNSVEDTPGQDNSTEKPKGSGWRKWLKPALIGGGILAVVAGLFFPPLMFLGGLLLGAAATHHLLGAAQ